ncbi:MAG: mitochondrial fission ELM1 family protein [Alphaproteobacteria bacterium]
MANQVVGLAERIGLPFTVKRLDATPFWRRLFPGSQSARWAGLDPPWPRLLIASGRRSVRPVLAVARASGAATFTVQIQDPRVAPSRFGLVVAPRHDGLSGPNVIATLGSMHGITPAKLAAAAAEFAPLVADLPRPRVAVLLGGTNDGHQFGPTAARRLGVRLANLIRAAHGSLMVTGSWRTDPAALTLFVAMLAEVPHVVWDGRPPNPYLGYLGSADMVVVTADSVNMTTESCATGKPVLVAGLPTYEPKFRRFHDGMIAAGHTRPLKGPLAPWPAVPLDETGAVAIEIRRRLGLPG